MPRVPLLGGAYRDKSPIASAQETVNLYPEKNTNAQAPGPVTHYLFPGSRIFGRPAAPDNTRCLYTTSTGVCYAVVGVNIYFVASNGAMIFIGAIPDRASQVIMADNGLALVLVDGVDGFAINLADNSFGQIVSPAFYGADYVAFLDTFFVFNRPNTNQFYISLSNSSFGMLTDTGVGTGTTTSGGAAYTDGTYFNVPLVSLTGIGLDATADITISGGAVTSAIIENIGYNYAIGDTLSVNSADVGGTGAGYILTLTSTGGDAFDPLDIAAKSGAADNIVGIVALHKELWLIGDLTTEIWIGTGAADFYFQQVQGAFIEHGCLAQFSIAHTDVIVFWIMKDKTGQFQIMQGAGYEVKNIATSYLVEQMSKMESVSDAIAGIFQVANHNFLMINFPTANITFVYDMNTEEFVRASWLNVNDGSRNRYRSQCYTALNGQVLGGDWENGNVYVIDPNLYTDFDGPIVRTKTFFHMVGAEFERVNYISFDADIECATSDINDPDLEPQMDLSWSDNRGITYGNAVQQGFGLQGEYLTVPSWNRLGQARDRVFKLEWSGDFKTSLLGGFATVRNSKS